MDVRNEPSMEEILASIKRIIAEDGTPPAAARARQPRPASMTGKAPLAAPGSDAGEATQSEAQADIGEEAEVLELTQAMPLRAESDAPPEEQAKAVTTPAESSVPGAPIVSDDAAIASRQALAALSAMIVKPAPGVDNSLEGLVREMLRPMLKEWLDAKLPELVEAMVAKEISRISGQVL